MRQTSRSMPELPIEFEKALLAYLKKNFLKGKFAANDWNDNDVRYFSKGILKLNQSFTTARSDRALNYFNDPVMRSGYLAYFLPVNAAKALGILQDKLLSVTIPKEIHIADIGSGPLTMTFAFLFHFFSALKKNPPSQSTPIFISVDAYELNLTIVKEGMALLRDYIFLCGFKNQVKVSVTPCPLNLLKDRLPAVQYDYVLAGNLFNEFETRDVQWRLCQKVLTLSKKNGHILFLEPASKKVSRDLQALRDQIIEGSFRILGPCLHHETCPLNVVAKSDWCHFRHEWQAPKFIQAFDDLTHLKKTHLMYSYLFLQNGTTSKASSKSNDFVAISDVMISKAGFEWVGCGAAGRVRFTLTQRDQSQSNQGFRDISRGKRFVVADYHNQDGYRLDEIVTVKKNDVVKIV